MLKATTSRVMRHGMPLTVLVIGILSLLMLWGTNRLQTEVLVQDVGMMQAIGEIQIQAANAHLRMEEVLAGEEEHLPEVWTALERAERLIDVIVGGGVVGRGHLVLQPVDDLKLRDQAIIIRQELHRFGGFAKRLHAVHLQGEPAHTKLIDVDFDASFNSLVEKLRLLEVDVGAGLDRANARAALLFQIMLVAWSVVVCLAVTGLWTREERRRLAEVALRESEAQLRQSQKMEAVGRLAGGLAHDINNYLAAMSAQCELVKMQPDDRVKLIRRMDAVMDTATKAASLIQRLLAFSRQAPLHASVVCPNEVVGGLEPILSRLLGDDVVMKMDLPGDTWTVKIDPGELEQVIVNLAVNAREAMPVGGRLTISTHNHAAASHNEALAQLGGGEFMEVRVSDTGTGIPAAILDKLFEPFVSSKDHAEGSGLGLATVYGILHRNGGCIQVETAMGEGSSFKVFLPRTLGRPTPKKAPRDTPVGAPGGSKKILLVEDNAELRASTQEGLMLLGYDVTTAEEGASALAIFDERGGDFDLLITDIVMPGINGREVAEKMQAKRHDLPVIYVSGYTDDVILRHGIIEEEVNYLSKPFSLPVLVKKIGEVLAAKSS